MEHRKERRRNEQRDSTPTQGLQRISQSNPKRIGEGEGFPKTKKELLLKYHVNNSVTITNDQPYCIFGNVPTLWAANNIYGKGTAEEWLVRPVRVRWREQENQLAATATDGAANGGRLRVSQNDRGDAFRQALQGRTVWHFLWERRSTRYHGLR